MSTASLPSYITHSSASRSLTSFASSTPLNIKSRRNGRKSVDGVRPSKDELYDKGSKSGQARLRLDVRGMEMESGEITPDGAVPVYGFKGCVEGVVEMLSSSNIVGVEAHIDGRLRVKEIAEGGTTSAQLCIDSVVLWAKDSSSGLEPAPRCPSSLPFSLGLPETFAYGDKIYPLPPTFHVKLSGLPGFTASIDYAVVVKIIKRQPLTPSSFARSGYITLSTSFVYQPRTRPSEPLPFPLHPCHSGLPDSLNWLSFQSEIRSRWQNTANVDHDGAISAAVANDHSIRTKLHIPQSRVFCISEPIPFYLTFESSAQSLAAFLPYAPGTVAHAKSKQMTRIELMRQSIVDVRNTTLEGVKTDIWRVDCIGEGVFEHAGDGPTWSSFTGEIKIDRSVRVCGFQAPALSVKDWIVLSVATGDSHRAAFDELRQVIPVRLTTDPWTEAPDQETIMAVGLDVMT